MTADAPMLKAAGLWEKTSAKGNQYFLGRLGGVRILILENRDRGNDGEPDWHLFFADGSPRKEAPEAAPPRRAQRRSAYPASRQARPAIRPDDDGLMSDDPVTDLWRGGGQ